MILVTTILALLYAVSFIMMVALPFLYDLGTAPGNTHQDHLAQKVTLTLEKRGIKPTLLKYLLLAILYPCLVYGCLYLLKTYLPESFTVMAIMYCVGEFLTLMYRVIIPVVHGYQDYVTGSFRPSR
jgi:hypothetical protein